MDKCSFLPSQMQLQKSWISSNIKTTCVQKIRKKGQQGNNTYQGQKHSCIISCKFTTYLITLFNKGLGNEKWRVLCTLLFWLAVSQPVQWLWRHSGRWSHLFGLVPCTVFGLADPGAAPDRWFGMTVLGLEAALANHAARFFFSISSSSLCCFSMYIVSMLLMNSFSCS